MTQGIFIPDIVEEDDGGIAAKHPTRFVMPLLVAPTHSDRPDTFNTVRHSLVTVACKDVPDAHFEFDSSFIGPKARKAFQALHNTLKRHDFECPLGIWGHADPEGDIDYNQLLSERRAEAVFALLVRDLDAWERLFSSKQARTTRSGKELGDVWGDAAIATILGHFGFPLDESKKPKDALRDAILRFETDRELPKPQRENNAAFRRGLFMEYMTALCVDANGTSYALSPKDFLGEGAEHGAFQGCSEFNPQLILAKAETDAFAKDREFGKRLRHEANRDNRRVMIFLFAKGTRIDPDPELWPCPRAKKGPGKCEKHLFSDHKLRREKQYPLRRRRFGKKVRNETDRMAFPETTFGCRFYHGLAQRSPCERDLQMFAIRLLQDAPASGGEPAANRFRPLANVRFVAVLGESPQSAVVRGRTSPDGTIAIPYLSPLTTITLKVDIFAATLGGLLLEDEDPNPKGGADTDRFDDEDSFVAYELKPDRLFRLKKKPVQGLLPDIPEETSSLEPDADEPEVSEEERQLGARQRLFNLGFGQGLSEITTPDEFRAELGRFQRINKLKDTSGELTDETVDELHRQHGS